jgi:aspartokinase
VIAVVSAQAPHEQTGSEGEQSRRQAFETRSYAEFLASGEKMSAHLLTMARGKRRRGRSDYAGLQKIFSDFANVEAGRGQNEQGKNQRTRRYKHRRESDAGEAKKFVEPLLSKGVIRSSRIFISDAEGDWFRWRGGSDITAFLCGMYLKATRSSS